MKNKVEEKRGVRSVTEKEASLLKVRSTSPVNDWRLDVKQLWSWWFGVNSALCETMDSCVRFSRLASTAAVSAGEDKEKPSNEKDRKRFSRLRNRRSW